MTNNLFDKKFHNFDLITTIRRFYKLSSIEDQLIIINRDSEGPQIRPISLCFYQFCYFFSQFWIFSFACVIFPFEFEFELFLFFKYLK